MRIAVTGATGFLGAHVIERLLAQGHEPVCLVRPRSDRRHLDEWGVTQVPGSLGDQSSLARLVRDADAVVHAAGTVAAWNKAGYLEPNTEGTRNLLAACSENPPQRFTYVSSLAAKGPSPTLSPLPAHSTARPVSTYGQSKLGGETALRSFAERHDTQATIVRPPALYGPRDRRLLGVMKAARRGVFALFLPPEARLSLLHGADCADLVLATVGDGNGGGRKAGTKEGVRLLEPADGAPHDTEAIKNGVMVALEKDRLRTLRLPAPVLSGAARLTWLVARATRTPRMLNPDKVKELRAKHWICDTTTTRRLDWSPRIALPEGLLTTKQWYEQEGWL